jgi:predicted DNA-binding transcriptional regulator AlpA
MLAKQLRFIDLLTLGVVTNRVTLNNWIRDRDFPRGTLIGPNTRVWDEAEVTAWLASRPTAPKPPPPKRDQRGRPRKNPVAAEA